MIQSKNLCFDMIRNHVLRKLNEELSLFKGLGKHKIIIDIPKCDDQLAPGKVAEELKASWHSIESVEYDSEKHALVITIYVYNS